MYDPQMTLTLIYSVEGVETVFSVPNIPLTHAYYTALQAAGVQAIDDADEFIEGEWNCIGISCVRDVFRETDAENIVVVRREEPASDSFLYLILYRYEEEEEEEEEDDVDDYDTVSIVSSTDIEDEDDNYQEEEEDQTVYTVYTPPPISSSG